MATLNGINEDSIPHWREIPVMINRIIPKALIACQMRSQKG
jgi:hypothetical protein